MSGLRREQKTQILSKSLLRQSQYKIVKKMNTLQCDVCSQSQIQRLQQCSAETASQLEASLVKASEAAEILQPAYVYCQDCRQYLCKPCDYRVHHQHLPSASNTTSNVGEDDEWSNQGNISPTKADSVIAQSQSANRQPDKQKITTQNSKSSESSSMRKKQAWQKKQDSSCTEVSQQHLAFINHVRTQICEECAEEKSKFFCPKCEQALCQDCWSRIHNKAARKRHQQKTLKKVPQFYHPSIAVRTPQPSASGSSQLQDSLSQINQEQGNFDRRGDMQGFDEPERMAMLGGLQVKLQSCLGPQGTTTEQTRDECQGSENIMAHHQHSQHYNVPQAAYNKLKPPRPNTFPEYGQSPQYVYQHHPDQKMGQMHQSHPQMGYPGGHAPYPTFVPPQHAGHYYMYPTPEHFSYDTYGRQQHAINWYPASYPQQHSHQPQHSDFSSRKVSEDDLSTGIYEEAKLPQPNAFLDLDRPRKQTKSSTERNLNSGENLTVSEDESAFNAQNQKLTDPKLVHTLSQGESRQRPAENQAAFQDLQSSSKSFTPLRHGQQSSNEFFRTSQMNTPDEQLRVDLINNSKLMTPPVVIVGGQGAKVKPSALQMCKANRPLKVPRGNAYVHAQSSLYYGTTTTTSGQSGISKTTSEKKGPHIQYQVKTGKPNSLSSHEMNSDQVSNCSEAYQLQSSSAKSNHRMERLGPRSTDGSNASSNQREYKQKPAPYQVTTTQNQQRYESSYGVFASKKSGSMGGASSSSQNYQNQARVAPNRPRQVYESGMSYQPRRDAAVQMQIPIFQPPIQIELDNSKRHSRNYQEENSLMTMIQQILFEDAALGELLILKSKFVEQVIAKSEMEQQKSHKAVERAVGYGIIHQTDRNFGDSKKIEFISLKVQVMSHQCLQWVITSLRRDEMTPTETAIKNRTKEAFNFKLQNDYWEAVMKSIQRQPQERSDQSPQSQSQSQQMPPDNPNNGQSVQGSAHVLRQKANMNSGNVDSSNSHSSVGSAQYQALTTSTISAQGITRITQHKQSVITEADSGGSTVRNQLVSNIGNRSSGQVTTDSHGRNEAAESTMTNQDASYSAPQGSSCIASEQPRFKVVKQQLDALSSSEGDANSAYSIYMEDEEIWTGVDIDDDSTVDRQLYGLMINFLCEYFCPESQNTDEKRSTASAENGELRMIPGGRYGCTQFLKICGPDAIQKCSVGKTTQMVQLAIKEDILRHLKTQIVWSTQVDKHKVQQDSLEDQQILVQRKAKLEKVKEAIIEILAESKTGMSLAQLPQYLKKKLPFNLEWNELGFPKLKDLLNSMEDNIKVELRDANHPFAYLVHKKKNYNHSQHQTKKCLDKPIFRGNNLSEQMEDGATRQMVYCNEKLQQVVKAVLTLLQLEPQGIRETDLEKRVQKLLDFEFSFKALGCNSEFEFVKNYIMPKDDSIEFFHLKEPGKKTFILRSKNVYTSYFGPMIIKQNMMEHQRGAPNASYFPSSHSHTHFNRGNGGPHAHMQLNAREPSEILSSSNLQGYDHQQRIQTQPDDRQMARLSLQHPYFPTCESIYGDDTVSESCSSLQNQVKAISCLTEDYVSQNSISQPPVMQPSQNKNNIMGQQPVMGTEKHSRDHQMHPMQFQAWYPPPQQMPLGKNGAQFDGHMAFQNDIFNNLQIDKNFQGSAGMGFYSMPIDKSDMDENERRHSDQQHLYQIFQPYNSWDNDSPSRVKQQMKCLFDETSPAPKFNLQAQDQPNGDTTSDQKTQYDRISGTFLDQSIFSEPIEKGRGNLSAFEQDAGHKSIDIQLASRPEKETNSEQLLPPIKNFDDKVTLRSWHPKSTLSDQLEVRLAKQMNQIVKEAQASQSGDENQAEDQ